jgi:hypothetical protein
VRKRGPCAASCRRRHELRSSSPTRAWSRQGKPETLGLEKTP